MARTHDNRGQDGVINLKDGQHRVSPEDRKIEITVIHKPDDPIGIPRLSLGGTAEAGYYLVYRGTLAEARECLTAGWYALRETKEELPLSPDDLELPV